MGQNPGNECHWRSSTTNTQRCSVRRWPPLHTRTHTHTSTRTHIHKRSNNMPINPRPKLSVNRLRAPRRAHEMHACTHTHVYVHPCKYIHAHPYTYIRPHPHTCIHQHTPTDGVVGSQGLELVWCSDEWLTGLLRDLPNKIKR